MNQDEYSLTEHSERFPSIIELFKKINNRDPQPKEEISCYHHCSVMKKSFLQTFSVEG